MGRTDTHGPPTGDPVRRALWIGIIASVTWLVLSKIVKDHPLWDGRDCMLQVSDVLPNGLLQLRVYVSAADATTSWDLRCDIRERLVTYLQEKHPDSLPRFRADLLQPVGERPRSDARDASGSPAEFG